ncbi:MAG: hypothetical protein ACTSUE_21675 [Promethearchaeota archaeon]
MGENEETGQTKEDQWKANEKAVKNLENLPENTDYSYLNSLEISVDEKAYFERDISSTDEIVEMKEKLSADVEKVKETMKTLEDYFRDTVDQIGINRKEYELTVPMEYAEMKFVTILSISPTWIFIKCKILNMDDVPEKIKLKLYELILTSNFELNAVFYSLDPDLSSVWIENDLPAAQLGMENFDLNFNAIIFGIKYFVDNIAPKLDQKVRGTYDSDTLYT